MEDENKAGVALGLTIAIAYIVCLIGALLFPNAYMYLAGNFVHIDVAKAGASNITLTSSIIGLVESFVIGWIFGYLFMKLYNKL